jgi:hypothetical protein
LMTPGYSIPRVDTHTGNPGKELALYVRHEFRDGNPLWIYSQTGGLAKATSVNMLKRVPKLLAPVSRIGRAVFSLLF